VSAPTSHPDSLDTLEKSAPAPVEAGTVEIRYADYRVSFNEVFVFGTGALIFFVLPWVSGGHTHFFPVWFGVLFFGAGLFNVFYTLRRFRKAGPAITLDERGLHSTPWHGKRVDVDWDEIDSVTALLNGARTKRPYLGVRLKHPESRPGSVATLARAQGSHLQILTEGLQVSTDQLIALIQDYRARLGR